jgi:cyanophycin synthetase
MRILKVRHLKGVSAWSSVAALYAVIGDVPECVVDTERALRLQRLLQRLPVPPHRAQAAAGRRMCCPAPREPGDLVVELAVELQFLCGEFHVARPALRTAAPGVCNIALECREFALAEACLRAAAASVSALLSGSEPPLAETYAALLAMANEVSPVSSPGLVVSAATDRGIPVFRLGPDQAFRLSPDEVLQLGEGIHQKRLHPWGTMTDKTGFLAGNLANDKAFVKALWSQYGIPVPEGSVVSDESGARLAAAALGGPVIVKPIDADGGRGLTLKPTTPEAVSAAFSHAKAASASGKVIVERYLSGAWHRLLVVDQRLVAALRREPAGVVGDGRHTIRDLVALTNRDCRRGPDHRWPLRFVSLDAIELENLAAAGLTPDTVLPSGARAFLRETALASTGAESFDVTEQVHPETQRLALDAVGLVGLDIAGLDLIAGDISQPLAAQQGAFLEINEQPGIFMHAAPLCSPPRPVGEAIVESLFPGGHDGRVPLVVVIGRQVADCVAHLVAETLASTGRVVGLSTPQATQLEDRIVTPAGAGLPDRLSLLLRHPRTEMAVVSAPLEDVLHTGLGTDRCTVLVLADGLHPSAGNGQAESRHEIDRLLERLFNAATRCVVNAADPFWRNARMTGSPDVCLVAAQADDPGVCEHLTAGGAAAILEPAGVFMQAGSTQTQYHPFDFLPDGPARPDMRLARAIATATYVWLARTLGTTGGEALARLAGKAAAVTSNNRTTKARLHRPQHGAGRKQMIKPQMDTDGHGYERP